jgi:hypothetical protein
MATCRSSLAPRMGAVDRQAPFTPRFEQPAVLSDHLAAEELDDGDREAFARLTALVAERWSRMLATSAHLWTSSSASLGMDPASPRLDPERPSMQDEVLGCSRPTETVVCVRAGNVPKAGATGVKPANDTPDRDSSLRRSQPTVAVRSADDQAARHRSPSAMPWTTRRLSSRWKATAATPSGRPSSTRKRLSSRRRSPAPPKITAALRLCYVDRTRSVLQQPRPASAA